MTRLSIMYGWASGGAGYGRYKCTWHTTVQNTYSLCRHAETDWSHWLGEVIPYGVAAMLYAYP